MDVDIMNIVAQVMGVLYTVAIVASVQFKARRNIVLALMVSGIFNNVAMILLGEYSGMVMNSVGIVLALISYGFARVNKVMPMWSLGIFIAAQVVACVLMFVGLSSIVVLLAQVTFVFSMGAKRENIVRWFLLVNAVLWTVFNIMIGSYGATIGSAFFAVSTAVALVRYRKRSTKIK